MLEIIHEEDNSGKYTKQGDLFNAVTSRYNTIKDIPKFITSSIVRLRIIEWDIALTTPKGRRGRCKGTGGVQPNHSSSSTKPPKKLNSLRAACALHGNNYNKLVDKIERRHLKSAIKLQHLQCMGFDWHSVQQCDNSECSLWSFR